MQTLGLHEGTLKTGRLQFDTGLIYNTERLSIVDAGSIVSAHGARRYKIANRIDFALVSGEWSFHLFVSHWPSRAIREENILSRQTVADRLKEKIRALAATSTNVAIIVVGDFNDEPFDQSLAWHMLATRDRDLAKSKRDYLYNPFWRHMGESKAYSIADNRSGAAGSCFYREETTTRWRTFDQMLFSPAFLGTCEWHLNENQTMILETDFLMELIRSKDFHFDHLPIISAVEKRSKRD